MTIINGGRFELARPFGMPQSGWEGYVPPGGAFAVPKWAIGWRKVGTFPASKVAHPLYGEEAYFREQITLLHRHTPASPRATITSGIAVNFANVVGVEPRFTVMQGSYDPIPAPVEDQTSAGEPAAPITRAADRPEVVVLHYFNYPFGIDPAIDGYLHMWGQFDATLPTPTVLPPEGFSWGSAGEPVIAEGIEDQVWVTGVLGHGTDASSTLPPASSMSVDIYEWWGIDREPVIAPFEAGVRVGEQRRGVLLRGS